MLIKQVVSTGGRKGEDSVNIQSLQDYNHTGPANVYSQPTVVTPPGYVTFTVSIGLVLASLIPSFAIITVKVTNYL